MSNKRSATTSAQPAATPARPRSSSSLLLVNQKNEVLMIQRTNESRTFAGMHAFPGGNYDAVQDSYDPRITAIRETFEETGILLATHMAPPKSGPSSEALSYARKAIHSRADPLTFPAFLADNHFALEPIVDCLIPFSRWITPTTAKLRFATKFYVAFLAELEGSIHVAEESVTLSSSPETESTFAKSAASIPVPTHDNQIEINSTYFSSPRDIIASFDQGMASMMPPQYYLLTTLAELLEKVGLGTGLAGERSQYEDFRRLVGTAFGERVFNPRFGSKSVGQNGLPRAVLMYEGDAEYEGSEETAATTPASQRHRSLVTFKDGRPCAIRLERNINVFAESGPSRSAKL